MIDGKSYIGYCFTESGAGISWESKIQEVMDLSIMEGEYMTIAKSCTETSHLETLRCEVTNTVYPIASCNDSQIVQKVGST